jgi:hypothetical protein
VQDDYEYWGRQQEVVMAYFNPFYGTLDKTCRPLQQNICDSFFSQQKLNPFKTTSTFK